MNSVPDVVEVEKAGSRPLLVSNKKIGVSLDPCPRVKWSFLDTVTGELRPGSCKTYGCEVCGPKKLKEFELLLAWAGPERMFTLTLAPEDHQTRLWQIRNWVRSIRGDGYRFQYAWSVEENPGGTGHHVHMLQRGDFVPIRKVVASWGGRVCYAQRLKGNAGLASAYLVKAARWDLNKVANYTLKKQEGVTRPLWWSRDYFHGTSAEARQAVRGLLYGPPSEKGRWVKTHVDNKT